MKLRQTASYLKERRKLNKARPLQEDGSISYANWWAVNPAEYWFTGFVRHYFPESGADIRFYSVFGPFQSLMEDFDGIKIFFSGENLERPETYERLKTRPASVKLAEYRRSRYGDYGRGKVDIALGFSDIDDMHQAGNPISERPSGIPAQTQSAAEKLGTGRKNDRNTVYIRFPLWITYLFRPEDQYDDILERIRRINQTVNPVSSHGAACIASHDFFGTRTDICDSLESAGVPVTCAGIWRNNTPALKKDFRDDKLSYLRTVRFNICPENVDADHYVTEKLFDAFRSGTIPVYHGSLNQPEPRLINPGAVLFWDFEHDNDETIKEIIRLERDDKAYLDFVNQIKIRDSCAEYVFERMTLLRTAIGQLL